MNEADITRMADMAVSAGTVSREQANQWAAADIAALKGAAPPVTPAGVPSPDESMRARAAELIRTGAMTQEQADAALSAYLSAPVPADAPVDQQAATAAPSQPLAASGATDPFAGAELPDGFGPPARPEDYRFDMMHADPLTFDQAKAVAETFHVARMPAPIASQVYSEIVSMSSQNLGDAELQMLNARTMAQLNALWGSQTEGKIATARTFLQQLDKARPGVLSLLERSRAGSSPIVIRQLVEHAERLKASRRR